MLKALWQPGKKGGGGAPLSPQAFKRTLSQHNPMFSGYDQHDAHELAAFLLDGLHEDLNRHTTKKPCARAIRRAIARNSARNSAQFSLTPFARRAHRSIEDLEIHTPVLPGDENKKEVAAAGRSAEEVSAEAWGY